MKRKLYLFLLSLLVVAALVFTACDKEDTGPKETPEPTEVATKAPTPEPTPTPTPKPTVEPIPEDKKGFPQEDAEELFKDTFDEEDFGNYLTLQGSYMAVEDGKLIITEHWSAYSPIVDYQLGVEHSQYQMSVTFSASSGTSPWSSLFVGCRGPEGNVTIADKIGYFWVAFNKDAKAHVYPGGGGVYHGEQWNLKYFTIDLPEDFTENHTVTVVDCGDIIAYYMNTAEEDYYLILKVTFEGEELVIHDHDGNEIWREENMLQEEGSFLFFNHYCASLVDEIVVKGYK
jgi:hypothetical protein